MKIGRKVEIGFPTFLKISQNLSRLLSNFSRKLEESWKKNGGNSLTFSPQISPLFYLENHPIFTPKITRFLPRKSLIFHLIFTLNFTSFLPRKLDENWRKIFIDFWENGKFSILYMSTRDKLARKHVKMNEPKI